MKLSIGRVLLGDTGQWAEIIGLKCHSAIPQMVDLAQASKIVENQDARETLELLFMAMEADGILKMPVNSIPHTAHAIQFVQAELAKAKGHKK